MPRAVIIQPNQSYTFADYFKLNFAPQDILAYFHVSLQRRALKLPHHDGPLDRLTDLKTRIEESLPRLSLTSEMARREFLLEGLLRILVHILGPGSALDKSSSNLAGAPPPLTGGNLAASAPTSPAQQIPI